MAENTHWPEMQREKQELPAVIESNPPASNTYPHFIQNNVDEIDLSKVFQRIQKQTAPLAEAVQRIQKQTAPLAEAAQRIQKQTLPIVEAVQRIQKQTSPIVEAVQRIQAQQAYFDNTVRALQKKLAIQNRMLQELSTPRNVFGNNAEHVLGGFGSLLGNHSHTHSSIFGNHSHNQVLGNLGNSNKKEY